MAGKKNNSVKGSEGSLRDSLGFGGLILVTELTTLIEWSEVVHVVPFKYVNAKDGTLFTKLGFTPKEGGLKDTEIDLVATGIVSGTVSGEELYPPVLRVGDGSGGFELVQGTYTSIHLSAGRVLVYGES